jgi:hypothetical protein
MLITDGASFKAFYDSLARPVFFLEMGLPFREDAPILRAHF